eukprot:TRINITY_DN26718_c0_g4_i3.p1 TRINITY_DN26718_c0_g4~~TRINITY_DN26718_c0_g4_i3.p1  ORF type:complete len:221 (-),score=9.55 TRINITY_DN26718_c0_g4_i3:324-986(-)
MYNMFTINTKHQTNLSQLIKLLVLMLWRSLSKARLARSWTEAFYENQGKLHNSSASVWDQSFSYGLWSLQSSKQIHKQQQFYWLSNFWYATKGSRMQVQPKISRKPLGPGIVHVQKTRNNTIMTLTDLEGKTKGWVSAGSLGMRNARKSTPHAGELVGEAMANKVQQFGYTQIVVYVKGVGYGKSQVVRSLAKGSFVILRIEDRTPTPHNGCRPKKKRRV